MISLIATVPVPGPSKLLATTCRHLHNTGVENYWFWTTRFLCHLVPERYFVGGKSWNHFRPLILWTLTCNSLVVYAYWICRNKWFIFLLLIILFSHFHSICYSPLFRASSLFNYFLKCFLIFFSLLCFFFLFFIPLSFHFTYFYLHLFYFTSFSSCSSLRYFSSFTFCHTSLTLCQLSDQISSSWISWQNHEGHIERNMNKWCCWTWHWMKIPLHTSKFHFFFSLFNHSRKNFMLVIECKVYYMVI